MSSKVSKTSANRPVAKTERPKKAAAAKTTKIKDTKSVFLAQDKSVKARIDRAQKEIDDLKYIADILEKTVKDLGISSYKDGKINKKNHEKMIQSHLFNTIRGFDGNSELQYHLENRRKYEDMCNRLNKIHIDLISATNGKFDKLPNSIKEGLLDLAYNYEMEHRNNGEYVKGAEIVKNNSELLEAIKNDDYSVIVSNLTYIDKNNDKTICGLKRRSFNRAALACRDLQGKELREAIVEAKNIYEDAVKSFEKNKISTEKLEKEYNVFYKKYEKEFDAIQRENEAKEAARKDSIAQAELAKNDSIKGVNVDNQQATVEDKKDEPGFFERMWNKVKNIIKSWFSSEDKEYTFDENASVMSNMLNDKTVQKEEDGDFQIVTVDYEVKKGNNLYRLGIRYGITDNIIANNNDIEDKNLIQEGQIIKIQKIGYKVKKDDTVESIAEKFGVSVDVLKDINNIDEENPIKKNQIIEIPGLLYKAEKDGTLDKIAEKAGISVEKLMEINGLKENKVKAGDVLKVVTSKPVFSVPSNFGDIKDYPLLQEPMRNANGKIVATRKVFEPTQSGPLSGKTIIVNAGHGYKAEGGIDPGVPYNDIPDEWIINHRNALELKDKLCAQGAKVIFMQGYRSLISQELSKKENKADLFISVHSNAAGSKVKDRTQFYYYENLPKSKNKEKSKELTQMAEKRFDNWIPQNEEIEEKDKFYNNNKKPDYAQSITNDDRTGILKSAVNKLKAPAILWEVGFGSCEKGAERLNNPELMENYAKLMTETVVEFFQK